MKVLFQRNPNTLTKNLTFSSFQESLVKFQICFWAMEQVDHAVPCSFSLVLSDMESVLP